MSRRRPDGLRDKLLALLGPSHPHDEGRECGTCAAYNLLAAARSSPGLDEERMQRIDAVLDSMEAREVRLAANPEPTTVRFDPNSTPPADLQQYIRDGFEDARREPNPEPARDGLREALARHVGKSGWVRVVDGDNDRAWLHMQTEADGLLEVIRPWLAPDRDAPREPA